MVYQPQNEIDLIQLNLHLLTTVVSLKFMVLSMAYWVSHLNFPCLSFSRYEKIRFRVLATSIIGMNDWGSRMPSILWPLKIKFPINTILKWLTHTFTTGSALPSFLSPRLAPEIPDALSLFPTSEAGVHFGVGELFQCYSTQNSTIKKILKRKSWHPHPKMTELVLGHPYQLPCRSEVSFKANWVAGSVACDSSGFIFRKKKISS